MQLALYVNLTKSHKTKLEGIAPLPPGGRVIKTMDYIITLHENATIAYTMLCSL